MCPVRFVTYVSGRSLPRASDLFFTVDFSRFLQVRVTAKVKRIKAMGAVPG
jgi:hypothetical protein